MGIEISGNQPDRNSLEELGLFEERINDEYHPLQGIYRKHKFYEHEADTALIELVQRWNQKDNTKDFKYVTKYAEGIAGSIVSGLQMLDKLEHLQGDIFPEKTDPVLRKAADIWIKTEYKHHRTDL